MANLSDKKAVYAQNYEINLSFLLKFMIDRVII